MPAELTALARWVTLNKTPKNLEPDGYILDPQTWGNFDEERNMAFAITDDCPYSVVEVHRSCDSGVVLAEAKTIVEELDSYAERFLDRTGVRIIVRGKLPCGTSMAASGRVVIYDRMRFGAVSGWHLDGAPKDIIDAGDRLRSLVRRYFPGRPPITPEGSLSDDEVVERATRAHGEQFTELLISGDDPAEDRGLELARHLAYWTGRNSEQMRRLLTRYWSQAGRIHFLEPTVRKAMEGLPLGKDVPLELVAPDDESVKLALGMVEGSRGLPLWRASFALAQQLLTLGGDSRRFRPAVDAWANALGFDPDDAWLEFRDDVEKVNHPGGVFCKAVARAEIEAVPVPADYSARDRRLLSICHHLAATNKDRQFFLIQETVAETLGLSQATVSRMLGMFKKDGYLMEINGGKYVFGQGKNNQGKTYRWVA